MSSRIPHGFQTLPSLYDFVRQAWPIVDPAAEYIDSGHIRHICRHLEAVTWGKIKRLVINAPPGSGNSLIVSVLWPAWMSLWRPELRLLTASYSRSLATRDVMRMRLLMESEWYKRRFKPDWTLEDATGNKSEVHNSVGGTRRACGVGNALVGWAADGLIIDTPLTPIDALSQIKRDAANEWLNSAIRFRLQDMGDDFVVLTMQREGETDMSGHLLALGNCEHLCLPSRFVPERAYKTCVGTDWRSAAGELLFPGLYDEAVLSDCERNIGPYLFAQRYQQLPAPPVDIQIGDLK